MIKKNGCKMRECLSTHRREIVGGVFLILATLLTVLTLSGLGIFGMFLTGLFMCCHRHICCCKNSNCCEMEGMEHEVCDTTPKSVAPKKTTKAK